MLVKNLLHTILCSWKTFITITFDLLRGNCCCSMLGSFEHLLEGFYFIRSSLLCPSYWVLSILDCSTCRRVSLGVAKVTLTTLFAQQRCSSLCSLFISAIIFILALLCHVLRCDGHKYAKSQKGEHINTHSNSIKDNKLIFFPDQTYLTKNIP